MWEDGKAIFGGQQVEGQPNGVIRAVYYDGSIYEGQATSLGPHGWGRKIFAKRKIPGKLEWDGKNFNKIANEAD